MREYKIFHIGDTHTFHNQIVIPPKVDIMIHSGDATNPRDPYTNEKEMREFIDWYETVNIEHKIFIAGNHDTSTERKFVVKKDFEKAGIIYLEHESVEIEGLNIFGSPYTPTFGNWAFMKDRAKLDKYWKMIPDNTDIVIVHGPPKTILDLSYSRDGELEFCGDQALYNNIVNRVRPKLMCFGHIHNYENIHNAGLKQLSNHPTIFSNGSCVEDGRFEKGIVNNGNLITITK